MTASSHVSPNHKSHEQLHRELSDARKQVCVGGTYSHYKYPENAYLVTGLGFIEASDEVCVIYQATYDTELVFVRPLRNWLEKLDFHGEKVLRFAQVK